MNIPTSAKRFALAGIAVTLIHITIATGLIEKEGLYSGIANGIAFTIANLISYIINTCWSFEAKMRLDNWGRFIAVSITALGLSMVIPSIVTESGGHYLLGIGLVCTIIPTFSFAAHQKFTYR